ncbi:MAG: TRAP transporter substrate-binding protein DctP [Myxococcales bacterium]|nr:TRAP transporter substrate-binding protein DctP [Myxococcales bacterium]MDD9968957.1 TRAP transporter substrate-binding protein DctP [Myxococcales bacterium]
MRAPLWILLFAISLACPPPAVKSQAHHVLKMATTAVEGSPLVRQMQRLAAIIEERTAGLVLVKLFPGGRLGGSATLIKALRSGSLHIYGGNVASLAQTAPALEALSVPFSFRDYQHADGLLDGPVREQMEGVLQAHGMVFGAWGPNVFMRWFSNGPPPRTPDGLASRTVLWGDGEGGEPDAALARLSEGSTAGVVSSGDEHTPWLLRSTAVAARARGLSLQASHVTRADDVLHCDAIVLSQTWLSGLPAKLREALDMLPHDPTLEARKEARALDEELVRRMAHRGKQLLQLTAEERRALSLSQTPTVQAVASRGDHATALLHAIRSHPDNSL